MPMHHAKGRVNWPTLWKLKDTLVERSESFGLRFENILFPARDVGTVMSENYAKIKVSLENAETSKVKTCKHTDGQYGQSGHRLILDGTEGMALLQIGLVHHQSSFLNMKQLGNRDEWVSTSNDSSLTSYASSNLNPADVRMKILKWRKPMHEIQ